ncbi:MAG: choice-of-anchor tandem repeat GloVer-containing protein [Bryobacteraceae bacterium]
MATRHTLSLALLAWGIALPRMNADSFQIMHDFGGSPSGTEPLAGLIRDAAGNLYGTAEYGGDDNSGVVFRISPAGKYTLLHAFHGTDGAAPVAGLVEDQAGNLYGAASLGGRSHHGVIFKIDAAGAYSVLHNFTGADGSSPQDALILDSAGNLYGATVEGGASGKGVVFKLDTSGNETVLYSFTGGADGSEPHASLIQDSAGNLYGTAAKGGAADKGVVFMLDASGQETVLHSFTAAHTDGAKPLAGLLRDSTGNLFGTTSQGGAYTSEGLAIGGIVFKIDTSGQETVLYNFSYDAGGDTPMGNLILDAAGNLYGVALAAGNQGCTEILTPYYIYGCGVVFKLDTGGHETVLYSFSNGPNGYGPAGGLVQDPAGNFYGTTEHGGASDWGVVFKLDTAGLETVLWNFTFETDGTNPAGMLQDSSGNFYGTATNGGLGPCADPIVTGCGVVFKLDPAGNEAVLYSFLGGADGAAPVGAPIPDADGNLYGVTSAGGALTCVTDTYPAGCGVIYKLDAQGKQTVLYTFTGSGDGQQPAFGLVRDSAGNFYGSAPSGGSLCSDFTCGVIFKIDPAGKYSVIHRFDGDNDGFASGALTLDATGNIYGVAGGGKWGQGMVFKLDTAGKYTVLHDFTGGKKDAGQPIGPLLLDPAGNIYGTMAINEGAVFKLDPQGSVTILYTFTADVNGWYPNGGLVEDAAGNLYGTTLFSGTEFDAGGGIVFELSPSGNLTVVHNFTSFAGGQQPVSLFQGLSGELYGVTIIGGSGPCVYGCGVAFKVEP